MKRLSGRHRRQDLVDLRSESNTSRSFGARHVPARGASRPTRLGSNRMVASSFAFAGPYRGCGAAHAAHLQRDSGHGCLRMERALRGEHGVVRASRTPPSSTTVDGTGPEPAIAGRDGRRIAAPTTPGPRLRRGRRRAAGWPRQGWAVTGVDWSDVALDRARSAIREAGLEVHVRPGRRHRRRLPRRPLPDRHLRPDHAGVHPPRARGPGQRLRAPAGARGPRWPPAGDRPRPFARREGVRWTAAHRMLSPQDILDALELPAGFERLVCAVWPPRATACSWLWTLWSSSAGQPTDPHPTQSLAHPQRRPARRTRSHRKLSAPPGAEHTARRNPPGAHRPAQSASAIRLRDPPARNRDRPHRPARPTRRTPDAQP